MSCVGLPLIESCKKRVYFDEGYVDHIKTVHMNESNDEIVVFSERTSFYNDLKNRVKDEYHLWYSHTQDEPKNIKERIEFEAAKLAKGTNRATEKRPPKQKRQVKFKPTNVQEQLEAEITKLAKGTNRNTEEENNPRQRENNVQLDVGEFAPAENNRYVIHCPSSLKNCTLKFTVE
jgi:16S rRNA U1498 N3-methylase RsmE